jgi:hypothetical protein
MNWWPEPKAPARNWLLEDITIQHNAGEGFRLNHLRDFTLRRVRSVDNGGPEPLHRLEGRSSTAPSTATDCASRPTPSGTRCRTSTWNSSFSDNKGNAFRNDHVAENLLIENCRFNNNSVQAITFETATGPITDPQQRGEEQQLRRRRDRRLCGGLGHGAQLHARWRDI